MSSKIYKFIENLINKFEKFQKSRYELKLKNEKQKLDIRKTKSEIREIKNQYNPIYNRISKFNTHKIIMYFIFVNCSIVEYYSMRVMILFEDLSPLPTLMVSVITESISYAIYCAKSYSGTKQEKIQELNNKKFELEKEMAERSLENNLEINSENDNLINYTDDFNNSVG